MGLSPNVEVKSHSSLPILYVFLIVWRASFEIWSGLIDDLECMELDSTKNQSETGDNFIN